MLWVRCGGGFPALWLVFPAFAAAYPAFAAAYPAFGVSRFLGQKLSKGHLPQWGFRAVHT